MVGLNGFGQKSQGMIYLIHCILSAFVCKIVKVAFRDNFGLSAVTSLRKECVRPEHFRNNTMY